MHEFPPYRIGQGYDLHRLQPGGKLVLGGVVVSTDMSPVAHSDGDVVIHAIVDAICGALGTGDIGSHVARLFSALGAEIHGVSRSGRGDSALFTSISTVSELPSLVPNADWLIVAIPLTSDSRGVVSREIMSRCRGAVLINAGRGATVEESSFGRGPAIHCGPTTRGATGRLP